MRLPELDREAIKIQPLSMTCSSNGFPDIGVDTGAKVDKVWVTRPNRDFLKIPVLGCDGLQCRGDPPDLPRFRSKNHFFEFRRSREINEG